MVISRTLVLRPIVRLAYPHPGNSHVSHSFASPLPQTANLGDAATTLALPCHQGRGLCTLVPLACTTPPAVWLISVPSLFLVSHFWFAFLTLSPVLFVPGKFVRLPSAPRSTFYRPRVATTSCVFEHGFCRIDGQQKAFIELPRIHILLLTSRAISLERLKLF